MWVNYFLTLAGCAVVSEKEKIPMQARPQLERSIEEVLNHTRNTSGERRIWANVAVEVIRV
jgi:hypothetical protein